MIGDAIDFKARLRATLPVRWFPDTAPVLDALLGGLASAWASVYALLQYMRLMARISTAAGTTLDFIAGDYFGRALVRRIGEADFFFAARIKAELLKPRATRAAVITAVTRLTGVAPLVFEPSRPADTGAYNSAVSLGYGVAGGYGSYARQSQFYIVVTHGVLNGPPLVGGYYKGSGWAGGGYGSTLPYPILRANDVRYSVPGTIATGVIGSGGVMPTGWNLDALAGLTQTIVGTGVEGGLTYLEIRVSGTASGTINLEADTWVGIYTNTAVCSSFYARLTAGSWSNVAVSANAYLAGAGAISNGFVAIVPTSAALNTQRFSAVATAGSSGNGDRSAMAFAASGAVDFTIRVAGFQQQAGSAPTAYTPTNGAAINGADYAGGALEYWSGASPGAVKDADIFAAIAGVLPVGVTAWVQFTDGTQIGTASLGAFVLGINSLG
jgi:hypothetical protein